jgi:hypothetical protein
VEIRTHLATMLRDRGLATSPMFTIPESPLEDGFLPKVAAAPLLGWLSRLARDSRSRDVVVRRSLAGALDSFDTRIAVLVAAADDQEAVDATLRRDLDTVFAKARAQVAAHLSDGTLLRGEVLARWQEFIGTGEWFKHLESSLGRFRDRVTATVRGRTIPSEPLGEALQTGVQALVRAAATAAVEDTALRWRAQRAGAALLAAAPDAALLGRDFDARLGRTIRDWQGGVLDMVRTEGQGRRVTARVLSLGVNGAGVVLMLVVFSHTAGLTGAEVGVAAGTAAVAQHILEALFGDQAVRSLATKARKDLQARVDALMAAERERLVALLDDAGIRPGLGASLRAAALAVEEAR